LSRDLSFEARTSTPPPLDAGIEELVEIAGEEEEDVIEVEADGAFVLLCFAAISRSVRNTPAAAGACCVGAFVGAVVVAVAGVPLRVDKSLAAADADDEGCGVAADDEEEEEEEEEVEDEDDAAAEVVVLADSGAASNFLRA